MDQLNNLFHQWNLLLSAGATFVAQSFSTDLKDLTAIIEAGINIKDSHLLTCLVHVLRIIK